MTGKGIGKRGRLALVFYLRVIIVCRRLSTTYDKTAVKRNLAFSLGGEVQGIIHIQLILKDQRERGNFIGQEERESTFSTKKPPCAQQESQCARRLKERIARRGGGFIHQSQSIYHSQNRGIYSYHFFRRSIVHGFPILLLKYFYQWGFPKLPYTS